MMKKEGKDVTPGQSMAREVVCKRSTSAGEKEVGEKAGPRAFKWWLLTSDD